MNILHIGFYHNELRFLPAKKRWNEYHGLNWYVIDNESNDGTAEWLEKNGINHEHFSTEGRFDLIALRKRLLDIAYQSQCDWILYLDADSFICNIAPFFNLFSLVKYYNGVGYNLISFSHATVGFVENDNFYGNFTNDRKPRLWKKDQPARIKADEVMLGNPKHVSSSGATFNLNGLKDSCEREDEYNRRVLAWNHGLSKTEGAHYRDERSKKWLRDKNNLINLARMVNTEEIKQLTKEVTNVR